MLHILIVICNVELAPLARFIVQMCLRVAGVQELVCFPKLGRLVERLHFVSHARVFRLESQHLVHVKVRRLENNLIGVGLNLINLHELAHGWLPLRRLHAEVSLLVGLLVKCYVLLCHLVDVVLRILVAF